MELAIQLISTDQTVRNDTIQDLKDFNQQSLSTQAKKRRKRRAVNKHDASNQKNLQRFR